MTGGLGCEVQRMGFRCGHEVFNSGFGSFRAVDGFSLGDKSLHLDVGPRLAGSCPKIMVSRLHV